MPGSDLDVLVLTRDGASAERARQALAAAAPACFEQFGLELSPVAMSADRFRERAAEGDPFVAAATGRSLHVTGMRPDEVLRG